MTLGTQNPKANPQREQINDSNFILRKIRRAAFALSGRDILHRASRAGSVCAIRIDDFDNETLDLQWNFRRVPLPGIYSLSEREGFLRLHAHENTISERGRAALMGVRQRESDFQYSVRMEFEPERENVEAGVSLFQKDDNFLNFTVTRSGGQNVLQLTLAERDQAPATIERQPLADYQGEIVLRVVSRDRKYRYEYSLDRGENFTVFAETDAARLLSRGYTGAYLGLYSTANGNSSDEQADFDWVRYEGYERI